MESQIYRAAAGDTETCDLTTPAKVAFRVLPPATQSPREAFTPPLMCFRGILLLEMYLIYFFNLAIDNFEYIL